MRAYRAAIVFGVVAVASSSAFAQEPARPLSDLETSVACTPPATFDVPFDALHVIGSQDTVSRSVFGEHDLLVIGGGTGKGLQVGQRYFVRRPEYFGTKRDLIGIDTHGWIRVAAVDETTAVATVEHLCGAIYEGDYLAPFAAPAVPADAASNHVAGELDFNSPGRVLGGINQHQAAGAGDYVTIDVGSEHGMAAGTRFALYRDVHVTGVPLSSVGEAVVVSTGPKTSVARITQSRDAVVPGDYVIPRK